MSLRYDCPECGERIVVKHLVVGELAQCPHCSVEGPVPADAETVDAPSTRADPRILNPDVSRSTRRRLAPRPRRRTNYGFLRVLPWITYVLVGLHTLVMIAGISQAQEPGLVPLLVIWAAFVIVMSIGFAQAIGALLEIVENTRAVLPPPSDTFD